MDRNKFIKTLMSISTISATTANGLSNLNKFSESFSPTELLPALFLGHGSPMNAIEKNEFVAGFRKIGQEFEIPKAILCISAHWETKGTFVTAMPLPKTIHDFGGFPKTLYNVQYPAPGSPDLANFAKEIINKTEVGLDLNWGLDHGAWSVLMHLYPKANVPIIQMSIDYTKPAQYHYDLAQQLAQLRSKGVLIVGSGNMVHNLGMVAWDKLNIDNYGYDWALEAKTKMNKYITDRNHQALINYRNQGRSFNLAIPSPEHFLPLIYTLALQKKDEAICLFNDKAIGGSLSMTSVKIG